MEPWVGSLLLLGGLDLSVRWLRGLRGWGPLPLTILGARLHRDTWAGGEALPSPAALPVPQVSRSFLWSGSESGRPVRDQSAPRARSSLQHPPLQSFVLTLKLWQGQTSHQTRAQLLQKDISPPPGYPLGRQSNLLHPLLTAHRFRGGGTPTHNGRCPA